MKTLENIMEKDYFYLSDLFDILGVTDISLVMEIISELIDLNLITPLYFSHCDSCDTFSGSYPNVEQLQEKVCTCNTHVLENTYIEYKVLHSVPFTQDSCECCQECQA